MADKRAFTVFIEPHDKRVIIIDVDLTIAIPELAQIHAKALVDTGASKSSIHRRISKKLKLKPCRFATVISAHGEADVPVYTTSVAMPQGITFENIQANEFYGEHSFDFIIGMDIITRGDMTISNANGKTAFSFRVPPADTHTDYSRE